MLLLLAVLLLAAQAAAVSIAPSSLELNVEDGAGRGRAVTVRAEAADASASGSAIAALRFRHDSSALRVTLPLANGTEIVAADDEIVDVPVGQAYTAYVAYLRGGLTTELRVDAAASASSAVLDVVTVVPDLLLSVSDSDAVAVPAFGAAAVDVSLGGVPLDTVTVSVFVEPVGSVVRALPTSLELDSLLKGTFQLRYIGPGTATVTVRAQGGGFAGALRSFAVVAAAPTLALDVDGSDAVVPFRQQASIVARLSHDPLDATVVCFVDEDSSGSVVAVAKETRVVFNTNNWDSGVAVTLAHVAPGDAVVSLRAASADDGQDPAVVATANGAWAGTSTSVQVRAAEPDLIVPFLNGVVTLGEPTVFTIACNGPPTADVQLAIAIADEDVVARTEATGADVIAAALWTDGVSLALRFRSAGSTTVTVATTSDDAAFDGLEYIASVAAPLPTLSAAPKPVIVAPDASQSMQLTVTLANVPYGDVSVLVDIVEADSGRIDADETADSMVISPASLQQTLRLGTCLVAGPLEIVLQATSGGYEGAETRVGVMCQPDSSLFAFDEAANAPVQTSNVVPATITFRLGVNPLAPATIAFESGDDGVLTADPASIVVDAAGTWTTTLRQVAGEATTFITARGMGGGLDNLETRIDVTLAAPGRIITEPATGPIVLHPTGTTSFDLLFSISSPVDLDDGVTVAASAGSGGIFSVSPASVFFSAQMVADGTQASVTVTYTADGEGTLRLTSSGGAFDGISTTLPVHASTPQLVVTPATLAVQRFDEADVDIVLEGIFTASAAIELFVEDWSSAGNLTRPVLRADTLPSALSPEAPATSVVIGAQSSLGSYSLVVTATSAEFGVAAAVVRVSVVERESGCPGACTARGACGLDGTCLCNDGFLGQTCANVEEVRAEVFNQRTNELSLEVGDMHSFEVRISSTNDQFEIVFEDMTRDAWTDIVVLARLDSPPDVTFATSHAPGSLFPHVDFDASTYDLALRVVDHRFYDDIVRAANDASLSSRRRSANEAEASDHAEALSHSSATVSAGTTLDSLTLGADASLSGMWHVTVVTTGGFRTVAGADPAPLHAPNADMRVFVRVTDTLGTMVDVLLIGATTLVFVGFLVYIYREHFVRHSTLLSAFVAREHKLGLRSKEALRRERARKLAEERRSAIKGRLSAAKTKMREGQLNDQLTESDSDAEPDIDSRQSSEEVDTPELAPVAVPAKRTQSDQLSALGRSPDLSRERNPLAAIMYERPTVSEPQMRHGYGADADDDTDARVPKRRGGKLAPIDPSKLSAPPATGSLARSNSVSSSASAKRIAALPADQRDRALRRKKLKDELRARQRDRDLARKQEHLYLEHQQAEARRRYEHDRTVLRQKLHTKGRVLKRKTHKRNPSAKYALGGAAIVAGSARLAPEAVDPANPSAADKADPDATCWRTFVLGAAAAGAALLATGHHMARFVRRVHSIGIGAYVVVVLLAIVSFAFSVLRVIFNVALLSSSFNAMAAIMSTDLPDMDEVAEALRDAVGPFASLVSFFVDIMRSLNFVSSLADNWNCGGAIVLLVPFLVALGTLFLRIVLHHDYLLKVGIELTKYKKGRGWAAGLVITAVARGAMLVLLFLMQVLIDILATLVVAAFTADRSCSTVDHVAVVVGRGLVIVAMVLFTVVNWTLFTGLPRGNSVPAIVVSYVMGVPRFILLTLGVWTNENVEAYQLRAKAAKFDPDSDNSDNQHEEVVRATAVSRSLVWVGLPGTLVLAKAAEAFNNPAVFNWTTKRRDGEHGFLLFDGDRMLVLHSSIWKRIVLFFFHVAQLSLTLLLVLTASSAFVPYLGAALVPEFFVNIGDGMLRVAKTQARSGVQAISNAALGGSASNEGTGAAAAGGNVDIASEVTLQQDELHAAATEQAIEADQFDVTEEAGEAAFENARVSRRQEDMMEDFVDNMERRAMS